MITYKNGDLLDVEKGVIIHGCNAQGVMGSGVAKQIKLKFPKAFQKYVRTCSFYTEDTRQILLGTINYVEVEDGLYVVNAITQLRYGNDGQKYVSYDAVDDCMRQVYNIFGDDEYHIPMIGAGLGGGDWNVIENIIKSRIPSSNITCWVL